MSAFSFHRATPGGEGGLAVFELYGGEAAAEVLRALFTPRSAGLPEEGRACLGDLARPAAPAAPAPHAPVLPGEALAIDEAIVARVPAAAMWSGLPAWTVTVHGGTWIQAELRRALLDQGGRELDLAGVLALAVAAGALDGVQAAAYELLVAARTEKAARFFLGQHAGGLSGELREGLRLAERGDREGSLRLLEVLLAGARGAFRLGHPLRLLITGRPNAGKSTLFNRLAGEERAAVTPIAGTTRDALEAEIAIADYPVIAADGAGIRDPAAAGPIERAGIEKVLARVDDAVVYLVPHPWDRTADDERFLARLEPARRLVVASLADLARPGERPPDGVLPLAALHGEGLDPLCAAIRERWLGPAGEVPPAPFTRRQRTILETAARAARAASGVDALRRGYVECLTASWPERAPADAPPEATLPGADER